MVVDEKSLSTLRINSANIFFKGVMVFLKQYIFNVFKLLFYH